MTTLILLTIVAVLTSMGILAWALVSRRADTRSRRLDPSQGSDPPPPPGGGFGGGYGGGSTIINYTPGNFTNGPFVDTNYITPWLGWSNFGANYLVDGSSPLTAITCFGAPVTENATLGPFVVHFVGSNAVSIGKKFLVEIWISRAAPGPSNFVPSGLVVPITNIAKFPTLTMVDVMSTSGLLTVRPGDKYILVVYKSLDSIQFQELGMAVKYTPL